MTKLIRNGWLVPPLFMLIASLSFAQKTPEITLEKVAEKGKELTRDKRVVVKVARSNISAKSAQANAAFGDELATMLTSAIQQTNCFRVMEMNRIEHLGTTDELIDLLGKKPAIKFDVVALEEGKANLKIN